MIEKAIEKACVKVVIERFPNVLRWAFDDGTCELTKMLDASTREGREAIAARAASFRLGTAEGNLELLEFLMDEAAEIRSGEILTLPFPDEPPLV